VEENAKAETKTEWKVCVLFQQRQTPMTAAVTMTVKESFALSVLYSAPVAQNVLKPVCPGSLHFSKAGHSGICVWWMLPTKKTLVCCYSAK
jgi:hypothetical protein